MNNPAQMVIGVFAQARDQEFIILQRMRSEMGGKPANDLGHIDVQTQLKRYEAAENVVEALEIYAAFFPKT